MTTPVLILLSIVFPLAWGWLTEAMLRRVWHRRNSSSGATAEDREPAVDFQI